MRYVTDVIVFAVLAFFAYVIVSLLIRDAKNKKIKEGIAADGVNTTGLSLMYPVVLAGTQGLLTSR
jgi:uncharacterized membrane protein YjfL (UPF0719 family)